MRLSALRIPDKLSTSERDFVIQAAAAGVRVDGRSPAASRACSLRVQRTADDASLAEALVGSTRACAIVTCELVAPYPDRPNEGMFTVSSEVAPCASPSGANVSLQLVERALRESKAIDVEGLCVQAGARVWSVKLQIVLLDDCGAVADAASLAALAALLHFRRPDVTVTGDACVVHGLDEKAPVPLAVHHVPLFITLAFMEEQQALVDPTHVEEAVARGIVALGLNGHREVCFASKTGAPMPAAALLAATQRALELRAERGDVLDAAVLAQPF